MTQAKNIPGTEGTGCSIQFLGAAGMVTGSKYFVKTPTLGLLVDCGMFQGDHETRALNWQPLPVAIQEIELVLLTHGHLDHVGYLPRLVKAGFKGRILATGPTLEITRIILKDTAKIQEETASRANREGYSRHKPAIPFYTLEDVDRTVDLFEAVSEGEWVPLKEEVRARFNYVGHILGATFIELEVNGSRIVFSGDIGRKEDLLLRSPERPERADVLLIESTYGDRIHGSELDTVRQLEEVVNATIERGGSLFIPSFAVERTQLLMLLLWRSLEAGAIPRIPMIIDTPMGANVLDVFHHTRSWHKLKVEECDRMCAYFRQTKHYRETLQLRKDKAPKIVIAGSGMVTGGRILNYLEYRAADPNDTLLFVGYQAAGTKGRALLEGATTLRVYGKEIPFKMQVKKINGLSAHADQQDLLWWLELMQEAPKEIFIVHGEDKQRHALQEKIMEQRGWKASLPQLNETHFVG